MSSSNSGSTLSNHTSLAASFTIFGVDEFLSLSLLVDEGCFLFRCGGRLPERGGLMVWRSVFQLDDTSTGLIGFRTSVFFLEDRPGSSPSSLVPAVSFSLVNLA